MKSVKNFLFPIITFILIFCLSLPVIAEDGEIRFDKWNQIEESYLITDDSTPSNSSLKNAVLKVTEDEASHRLTILFMLEFNSYTDISNAGIILSFNGGEEILIHTDKEAEYNEDKYFVSTVMLEQEQSNMVFVQTVLGIKDGLTDKRVLTVQVKDTEGLLSNRYTVDISPDVAEQEQTTVSESKKTQDDKTQKTNKTKTTAARTTVSSLTEASVTAGRTEQSKSPPTLSTGKVVGSVTGIFVLILSAGYGLAYLIKSKQQKRGEG